MSIEDRSTLVFASDIGRIKKEKIKPQIPKSDGIVRIQIKKLAGGKVESLITGIPLEEFELKELARKLKQKCGVGGSVKNFVISIQGDKRIILKTELEKMGYKVM